MVDFQIPPTVTISPSTKTLVESGTEILLNGSAEDGDGNDTIVINATKALGQLQVQDDKAGQKLIEIAQNKRRREAAVHLEEHCHYNLSHPITVHTL